MSFSQPQRPAKDPEYNAFSKVNLNAIDSDSDEDPAALKKRQEEEKKRELNKSGYQRPNIATDALLRSIQQSFEPGQAAYSPFSSLLNPTPSAPHHSTAFTSQPHAATPLNGDSGPNTNTNKSAKFDPLAAAAFGKPYYLEEDYEIFDEDEDGEDALTQDEQEFLEKFDLSTKQGQLKAYNALTDYILAKKDKEDPFRFGSTTICNKPGETTSASKNRSSLDSNHFTDRKKHPHHLPYRSGGVVIEEIDTSDDAQDDDSEGPDVAHDAEIGDNGIDWQLGDAPSDNNIQFGPHNSSNKTDNQPRNHSTRSKPRQKESNQTRDTHIIKYPLFKWSRVTPDGHIIKKVLEHGYSSISSQNDQSTANVNQNGDVLNRDDILRKINDITVPRAIGISYPTSYTPDLSIYNIDQTRPTTTSTSETTLDNTADSKKNTFASSSTLITDIPSISLPKIKCLSDLQTGQPKALTRAYGMLSVRFYDLTALHEKHAKTASSGFSNDATDSNPDHPLSLDDLASIQPDLIYSSLHEEVGVLLGQNQSVRGLEVAISTMNVGERALILCSSKYGGRMEYLGEYRHTFQPSFISRFSTLLKQVHPALQPGVDDDSDNDTNNSATLVADKKQELKQILSYIPPINPPSKVLHSSKKPTKPQFPQQSTLTIPYFAQPAIPPSQLPSSTAPSPSGQDLVVQNPQIPPYFRPADKVSNQICELTKPLHIIHNITYDMLWTALKRHKIASHKYFTEHLLDQILPNSFPLTCIPPFEGRLNSLVPNKPMQFLQYGPFEQERIELNDKSTTLSQSSSPSLYSLYPTSHDTPNQPFYQFTMDTANNVVIPLLNDKHYQDIIFSNPSLHPIVQQILPNISTTPHQQSSGNRNHNHNRNHDKFEQKDISESKTSKMHAFLRKSQRMKLPGQHGSTKYAPNQPSAMYGAATVANGSNDMTAGSYIIEFDFTLTRYEKELNLHTMTRMEKVHFIQQRRLLGKLLYTHYQKYQSAIIQYTKAVTIVEDDSISEHHAHNNDPKPDIDSNPALAKAGNDLIGFGQPKQQVVPLLTANERKHLSILLYTNIIQSLYQTVYNVPKFNAVLFYTNIILSKFNDTMNVKILYYKYRMLWYLNDIYQTHHILQSAIVKATEVKEMFESRRFLAQSANPTNQSQHSTPQIAHTHTTATNDLTANLQALKQQLDHPLGTLSAAQSQYNAEPCVTDGDEAIPGISSDFTTFSRYQDVLSFLPRLNEELTVLQRQLREEELTKTSKMQGFLLPKHYQDQDGMDDASSSKSSHTAELRLSTDVNTSCDGNTSTTEKKPPRQKKSVGFGADIYTKPTKNGQFEVDLGLYDDKPMKAEVKDEGTWRSQSWCEGMMNGARLVGWLFCTQLTNNWNKMYDHYFGKEWSYRGKKNK